ncbi:MAG TPA: hypothetical protein VEU94_10065, partial [Terriglobales bacterium]|nr:hypothetical protein [Terriglobales bacterium]
AVRRAMRTGLRRNAVIAIGNSGDRSFAPLLERLRADEDEVVAESADWAARRLSSSESGPHANSPTALPVAPSK